MVKKVNRSSPSASRRPLVPLKPSLSLKLLASAIALSPCLFQHSAQELLYPLFSTAPTYSLETTIPFYSLIFATFLIQKVSIKVKPSWRSCWILIGIWKILSEGLIRWYGEKMLGFGLTKGVLVGRLLLEAIPLLAMANWFGGQFECKEVSSILALSCCEMSLNDYDIVREWRFCRIGSFLSPLLSYASSLFLASARHYSLLFRPATLYVRICVSPLRQN